MSYVVRYEKDESRRPRWLRLLSWLQTPLVVFVPHGSWLPAGYAPFDEDQVRGGKWATLAPLNLPLYAMIWLSRFLRFRFTSRPPRWAYQCAKGLVATASEQEISHLRELVRGYEVDSRAQAETIREQRQQLAELQKSLADTAAELKAERERRARLERRLAIAACTTTQN